MPDYHNPRTFTEKEIRSLDRSYFEVTQSNYWVITLVSKNTKHLWHLEHTGYSIRIWHSHDRYDLSGYHLHGKARTLNDAIDQIKSHDAWQLNGRK